MRFWFGFIIQYSEEIKDNANLNFSNNFEEHHERLQSLVFEQLCELMITTYYKEKRTPIVESGSFWDKINEFDLLAITKDKQVILGECKYSDRKICKKELNKLIHKAAQSNINPDVYILFSKSGFSNELLQHQKDNPDTLLLFDISSLSIIL